MNKLLHPATAFLQALTYTEVAYKDMTPEQQQSIFRYMWAFGDGIWAEVCKTESIDEAVERFGDVKFGVGKFANDDVMKVAFVESTDGADTENPLVWFNEECICDEIGDHSEAFPVILSHADIAPEFGLFEWGYEWFYGHWARLPETEFIIYLPGWNADDDTGRGGQ